MKKKKHKKNKDYRLDSYNAFFDHVQACQSDNTNSGTWDQAFIDYSQKYFREDEDESVLTGRTVTTTSHNQVNQERVHYVLPFGGLGGLGGWKAPNNTENVALVQV